MVARTDNPAAASPGSLRAARPVVSLSVDLDPLRCYYQIHGLGPVPPGLSDVVLRRALPRFLALFRRYSVRATLFVVGQDLESDAGKSLLRTAAHAGHELGNHSYSHPYDLARLSPPQIIDEVDRCHAALRKLLGGRPPLGFRAPGYDLTPSLIDAVQRAGYRYDSSVFPCPGYYAAKLAALGRLRLLRRESASVMSDPRVLRAPIQPYRPDRAAPWARGQAALVELPIAVTPRLRLPAIGTFLLLSERLRIHLLESMRGVPFFNLELHGMDLLDADEDGIPTELLVQQPDLRVPLSTKLRVLWATLDRLAAEYEFRPLHEVAEEVHRSGGLLRPVASSRGGGGA